MPKPGYYGVRVGRDGPNVYQTWAEAEQAVNGFPGSRHKKFATFSDAQEWVQTSETFKVAHGTPFSSSYKQKAKQISASDPDTVGYSGPSTSLMARPRLSEPFSPSTIFLNKSRRTPDPGSASNPIKILSSPLGPPANKASSGFRLSRSAYTTQNVASSSLQHPNTQQAPEAIPEIQLSSEQERVLRQVMKGKSLFFTGSAGTGKSVLMRQIIHDLRKTRGTEAVAVTAPTGIASVNVGGVTLHSWAGIGLGKEKTEILVRKIRGHTYAFERWQATSVLVIDEISMVDGVLFDKLERVARSLRENEKPFGGMQVIVSGDFFQLPPVPERHDGRNLPVTYAFDAKSWNTCVPYHYELTQVFRQKDQSFIDILNKMRYGELDEKATAQFLRLSRAVIYDDDIEPTQLFPMKNEVERANNERLRSLEGPTITDTPGVDIRGDKISIQEASKSLDRLVALKQVSLRVGAQVMLIQNVVQGRLINGSLGKVVAFQTPFEARENDTSIAEVDQKSNSIGGIPKSGGVTSIPLPASQPSMDDDMDFDDDFVGSSGPDRITQGTEVRWPIVEFLNGEKLLLPPVEFSVVNVHGQTEAKREQIPLILAWALSIHKSQGQTLERVKIDLARIFEKGQAYVALSRATKIQTLQVLNFRAEKVMAHSRVLEWSRGAAERMIHNSDGGSSHETDSDEGEDDNDGDHDNGNGNNERILSEDEEFEDALEVIEISD